MKTRSKVVFLAYLLLSSLTVPAMAWPPPCPECYYWDVYESACVPICGECVAPIVGFDPWPATYDSTIDEWNVCIDDVVTFSAWPYTYDPDGCIQSYVWDFGRGAYDTSSGDSDWEYCKYGTIGDRLVTLIVTDNDASCCCDYNDYCCSLEPDCYDKSANWSETITVLEVQSLLPDEGTEFDDGDGNPDTKSFAVCVADTGVVTVTATPNPDTQEQYLPGYGYSWGWDLEGGTGDSLLTRTVDRTTPGVTTITCTCGSSSKTTKITVVEVVEVYEGVWDVDFNEGPVYVCSGETVHLWAEPYPGDWENWPDGEPTWDIYDQPTGANATITVDPEYADEVDISDLTLPGNYVIEAYCGDSSADITITVVEVDRLQYNDPDTGYTDISGTLYVHQGTNVTFKAISDPSGASWPSGKPVWGGTSGASGTGSTTSVTFNTLSSSTSDYKTVTAECGNTVTANVIVYDFDGVFTPDDGFSGRSINNYGLEETVDLTFTTDPTGVTAAQAGGLEWTLDGVGELTNAGNDGTANYDAKETEGNPWFTLEIKSGPSKYDFKSYYKAVIAPSGTRMTRWHPNTVWHIQGSASAGIALYYWLDPKNVSFSNLTFGEGSCPATGKTGIYITAPPGNHSQNGPVGITGGNITTGCQVMFLDHAGSLRNPWTNGGTYTWSIPTQYIDDTATRNTFGSNSIQSPTLQANGDATITKSGQSGSAALNDQTSGF